MRAEVYSAWVSCRQHNVLLDIHPLRKPKVTFVKHTLEHTSLCLSGDFEGTCVALRQV